MTGLARAPEPPAAVTVRPARAGDGEGLARVIEGALLAVEPGTVRAAVGDDADRHARVALVGGVVVGGLVRTGERVEAVAVAPSRRGQGVGTALVAGALDAAGRLTARFDPRVRGFYEALGFTIERDGTRCRGTIRG